MSASKGLFGRYLHRIFIETGSMGGDGIQQALDEGFEVVYSIEILPEWYNHCVERFKDNSKVHMILGDSGIILEGLLKTIDEPVTFWLDGHNGAESTPLLKELEIIKNHPVRNHTILIDDLRDWKMKYHGFNAGSLIPILKEINKDYTIIFEEGYKPHDVLVGHIL